MSFKLLAIRPLKGTDPSLLKGLKLNCIYRFYNEYDYLYDYDEKSKKGKSFIELQEKYFTNNENYSELEHKSIETIKYSKQLPDDFFGENISVSAIVGENGSGKSSLLELFYYTIVVLSRKFNVLEVEEKDDVELMKRLYPLVNVEFYFIDNEEISGCERFNKIRVSHICENSDLLNYDVKFSSFEINSIKMYFEVEGGVDELDLRWKDFTFYSNVLNYSMYALNSNISPWLHDIFHKNDGYQTPIVLNPMKEEGNNDVNIESQLIKNRGVFFVYALGFKEIIKGLYIHSIYFEVNINKSIYINNYSYRLIIEVFEEFFERTFSGAFNEYVGLVFGENHNIDFAYGDIIKLFDIIRDTQADEIKDEIDFNVIDSLFKEITTYKILNFLYVFKKLYKITRVYKNYRQFKFLFEKELPFRIVSDTIRTIEESIETVMPLYKLIEKDRKTQYKKVITIVYEVVVRNIKLINKEDVALTENELLYILESFKTKYRTTEEIFGKLLEEIYEKYLSDYNSLWIANDLNSRRLIIINIINYINDKIVDVFNGKEFRSYLFYSYLYMLNRDKSHITFKLNQARKYYVLNIFNALDIDNLRFENKDQERFVLLGIDKDYFNDNDINSSKIERVPNAFFDSNMQVVKTLIKEEKKRDELVKLSVLKPFNFDSLSSGEQHIINSMFTVAYHVYNLASVQEDSEEEYNDFKVYNIEKFNNINLFFDELELYLHPEYQRNYLYNMINILEKVKSVTGQRQLRFNLLFATHSPFILSDIPSQNVLKLKEGKPANGDNINSFGANIHDLLADEFFLKDGFMGEFAKEKIEEIIKNIAKVIEEPNSSEAKKIKKREFEKKVKNKYHLINTKEELQIYSTLKLIGEPILRMKLEQMYEIAFRKELLALQKKNEELLVQESLDEQILKTEETLRKLKKIRDGRA